FRPRLVTSIPASRADRTPGGGPAPRPSTELELSCRPDVPFAGDILSDDIARTETGPLQSKSYHARHLLRVSLRDPPRERAGGHRPEGVFGVSPARRM